MRDAGGKKRIVIIGGGASGTLIAYHLLRSSRGDIRVTIIEEASQLGFGLAYSTRDPGHLLNVRIGNMSALPDDPGHFCRWLARDRRVAVTEIDSEGFASRQAYGRYIAGLIDEVRARHTGDGGFEVKRGRCIGLWETPEGGVRARLANGRTIEADMAVIATGHDHDRSPRLTNPWAPGESAQTDARAPILILGSGLTMVDYVWTLLANDHRGPIHVLSRRGLLPSIHQRVVPRQFRTTDLLPVNSLSQFLAWMRAEAGDDWRSVIDGLRPHTQMLWQALSTQAKSRFLRHGRPWWDIHRHRMAPEIAKAIHGAIANGRLIVHAGKVSAVEQDDEGFSVRFRSRGSNRLDSLHVSRLVDCTGLPDNPALSHNPLTQHLLATGLARPEAIGLGLEFTRDCTLVAANGQASDRIYGVGPVTRPRFWEIIAIPDIRTQCAKVAEHIVLKARDETQRSAA